MFLSAGSGIKGVPNEEGNSSCQVWSRRLILLTCVQSWHHRVIEHRSDGPHEHDEHRDVDQRRRHDSQRMRPGTAVSSGAL